MEGIAKNAPIDKVQGEYPKEVLTDFWICCVSREASLLSRKEVLTGKAKFGITGDGKEVPQVAMARAWKKGDFRAGYYRDQTLMFALGLSSVEEYFSQLYADAENDPFSRGRQMNSHFATALIDKTGEWLDHTKQFNISSDISPTGGQMARSLGLAMASKVYREDQQMESRRFSDSGKEVCFCTIGDASTSEGIFWETVNAACVTKVPLAISVWDDGYGISVPIDYQTTKKSISKALKGFEMNDEGEGMHIYNVKAWDYAALVESYITGIERMRKDHKPALFHIEEVTQPQGHSTSGSHERYKSQDRLQFEKDKDCIAVMKQWIVDNELAEESLVREIEEHALKYAREAKTTAYKKFRNRVSAKWNELKEMIKALDKENLPQGIEETIEEVSHAINPEYSELVAWARKIALYLEESKSSGGAEGLVDWANSETNNSKETYAEYLYASGKNSAINVPIVAPEYEDGTQKMSGYQILNEFFDATLEKYPEFLAFGEDLGKIGDVNQGFAGLQEKYGQERVFDAGIREWSIIGQAIGMAMRGLRPLAEIQYLDYLIYALSPLSDDLATLRYRSAGQQQAPAIIRTRGHRLEGIWHAGSPLGMILNSLRGMHVLVPRNMTVAAGFYNTLLQAKDPALVIESLNGYRLKEPKPANIGAYTVPLGVPEILREGTDITLVTYGSMVRIAEKAAKELDELYGIAVELVDVQSLLPFDLEHRILESIKKTNRLLIVDEDVPGGASAYILERLLSDQGAFYFMDAAPSILSSASHRPPYGSDGDYFAKPSAEDIVSRALKLFKE
ncbi:MAG TPA: thiamine pyrophosphate-dependent enzyme [Saprospiraceae bacterium]|nr:thiamine pyrophosphate-dependent enzyme [Saprospiraceae bacterium]